jgi:hypothetical protein
MIYRFSVLAPVLVLMTLLTLVLSTPALNAGAGMEFVTPELPWAAVGKGYEPAPLEVRVGGACPLGGIGYSVMGGKLPPGLHLSRLGYFSGTASHAASYDFVIRAANGCSVAMKQFTIVVSAPPVLTITPGHLIFVAAEHDGSPEQSLLVSATWPNLAYNITVVGGDWLTALPEQGRTPGPDSGRAAGEAPNKASGEAPNKASGEAPNKALSEAPGSAVRPASSPASSAPGDRVRVRIDPSSLKPGHYSATLMLSAWQAAPTAAVIVELTVLAK